jgi:hypothetical protein
MNFDQVIQAINERLQVKKPDSFSSSWILTNLPHCYRFIARNIRTDLGSIDWDSVTSALDRKFQRRWTPQRKTKKRRPYEDQYEVARILDRYNDKLYVFISPLDNNDEELRDIISISLVRLAQNGNLSAKHEIFCLIRFTIDDWIEKNDKLACWLGRHEIIEQRLDVCIRRYRYSGSFIRYLYKTLVYAGRGLRPLYACSLDDPVKAGSKRRVIDNVIQDINTKEISLYKRQRPINGN